MLFLHRLAIFNLLFDLIKPSKFRLSLTRRQHRLAHRDRFLMVLMRIRLGILNEDLAGRFCVYSDVC